jgi:deferrochelatase/peroxidase EfeB
VPGTGGPAEGRESGISRRELFRLAGATGTGLSLGAGGMGAVAATGLAREREAGPAVETHPFYGVHQAGIATPTQSRLCFAAFDVTSEDRDEVRDVLREWSGAAAKLCAGEPVGEVGGEDANPYLPPGGRSSSPRYRPCLETPWSPGVPAGTFACRRARRTRRSRSTR